MSETATITPSQAPQQKRSLSIEEPYNMPRAAVGDTVYWYSDVAANKPMAAIVVRAGRRGLDLWVFNETYTAFNDNVPHLSDPSARNNPEQRRGGLWDYSEGQKKVAELEARLAALEKAKK